MLAIIVGGFLGSGKTTLIAETARQLAAKGKRVGIITNDQAADLVDTHLLSGLGIAVEEVTGGCFCCRFEDLEDSASRLLEKFTPDVLLGEPVGSCTDISATVLQPMKQRWAKWAQVASYSVLADPRRLLQVLDVTASDSSDAIQYIMRKQFEEADYLVINKVDLISVEELAGLKQRIRSAWPQLPILEMSALKSQGIAEWLDTITQNMRGGRRLAQVDYDTYARGESELGWLNASMCLHAHQDIDWNDFIEHLIGGIQSELTGEGAEIGHLKIEISDSSRRVFASVTSGDESPVLTDFLEVGSGPVSLFVNARARVEPQILKSIVERQLYKRAGETVLISELRANSFKPGYPNPTYHFDQIVE